MASIESRGQEIPPVWNKILSPHSKWQKEIMMLQDLKPALQPTLVGWDLHELAERSSRLGQKSNALVSRKKALYIVLLVQDWSGDLEYAFHCLLESLLSFEHVGPDEVLLVKENIILNITECRGQRLVNGRIQLENPAKLFSFRDGLTTSILTYDGVIEDVSGSQIGFLQGQTRYDSVRNICSIKMSCGDGRTIFRVFKRTGWDIRHLEEVFTTDEDGQQWVTNWKLPNKQWIKSYQ
ncbi:hypothetical protein IF1G_11187 [Cordyceps javanica]|uniref:Uncharacterized protein n=1 Tax=Cordyceps javanica TaxID=43265 RepID=A0A545UL09_9HYPO|nr:hypothetical protein IF1G_11187 [Cordyceps javanica]